MISFATIRLIKILFWCGYITVDFAMAASLNGFGTSKLFLHKQINIIQKITDKKYIFYFFHLLSQSSGEKRSLYMTHLLRFETPF
jgi:hypothetical protein